MRKVRTLLGVALILGLVVCQQEEINPPEGTGYIAASSTPPGASVYLHDTLTGEKTNCVIPDIEPGLYNVKLVLYDFPEWSAKVEVEEGETTYVDAVFQINEGTIKWVYSMSVGYNNSSPGIGPSGTVYICASGALHAINPGGTLKWQYATGGVVRGSPVIAEDETIYFGYTNNNLYQICAVNPDGSLKWLYKPDSSVYGSSPAIGQDGSIYFSVDNWLYALNREGTLKWKSAISGRGTPAIGADGTIYVGAGDYLYTFDPNGNLKWAFQGDGEIATPAIAYDGSLYFASGNYLCALSSNGALKWKYQTNGSTYPPAIGSDGTIYVGSTTYDPEYNPYASSLFAITPSGHLKWSRSLSSDDYISHIESTPMVGEDGMVYITHYPLGLCAFDENGNLKWNLDEVWSYSSPAIADDGTLYIGGYDGLYAIQTSSFGLADSPWPKFAHDNQNTGRAGAQ